MRSGSAQGDDISLDYYLIFATPADRDRGAPPLGVLVEEFVLCDDYTAAGIDSVEWPAATGVWGGSSASSRDIRADALLRSRVIAVSRHDAGGAYKAGGGGELPTEAEIRTLFGERQPLPAAAPLDLGATGSRLYRVLFAGELSGRGLANVRSALRLEPADDPAAPLARVVGTATATAAGHGFTWELRRIGPGIAWCLDVTVRMGTGPESAVGALLHHHRQAIRGQGLIPVTIERFR
ncbi:hypothetical protein [Nonomuraea sp. NEAU-A123]|uniref:hypothetical protein n=1 Tax=Nonomuraea sp. NEAU-A123 TaxID=2839649 RepID=UPI001BE3F7A4|nr:hypothetical protein [Nonomuraea sp. NEAU-A123]MBT2227017.1 hypothetical protein [Nonomuraea sp. NEAU-A123]